MMGQITKRYTMISLGISNIIKMQLLCVGMALLPASMYGFANDPSTDTLNNDIFIKVVSSDNTPFVGQAFTIKYLLYSSVAIVDPGAEVKLLFQNCTQQEFDKDQTPYREQIDGKMYTVITLRKFLIIASKEGELQIPIMKLPVKVNTMTNDFFGTEILVTRTILSTRDKINVRPLPKNGTLKKFSGIIGNFTVRGQYVKSSQNLNLLKFNLNIKGTGNMKSAIFNIPQMPNGIEIYNVSVALKEKLVEEGLSNTLEYSFEVVANYKGEYKIPAFNLVFYNTDSDRYESFNSDGMTWHVAVGPSLPTGGAEELIGTNIGDDFNEGQMYTYSPTFWAVTISGLIIGSIAHLFAKLLMLIKLLNLHFKFLFARPFARFKIERLRKKADSLEDIEFLEEAKYILVSFLYAKTFGTLNLMPTLLANRLKCNDAGPELKMFIVHLEALRFGPLLLLHKSELCTELMLVVKNTNTTGK